MSKVSVIIPTYNRAELIIETIQSVLDQTFDDFEIIVVDDGSTDNTKQVVDGFKDSRIKYIYQENRGVANARNNGIKASSGEYIAFLDSDDMWLPENLELKVKMLDSHPDVALVSSDCYLIDDDTGATVHRFWDKRPYDHLLEQVGGPRQPLALATLLTPTAALIRRRVFVEEVGVFDESLRYSSDWDIWLRILPRLPIKMIDTPLAKYRKHKDRLTYGHSTGRYLAGVTVLTKAIGDGCIPENDAKFLRRKLAVKHMEYGWFMITKGEINLGRKKLLDSIKGNPWRIRTYFFLAVSMLGKRGVIIFRRAKFLLSKTNVQASYPQDE